MKKNKGHIIIFEGPDGVGKSILCEALYQELKNARLPVIRLSFPGKDRDTLGGLVYGIHHDQEKYGFKFISMEARQALHIAAHLDLLKRIIEPEYIAGRIILLDRSWISTKVYGVIDGCNPLVISKLVEAELAAWGKIKPSCIFFVSRQTKNFNTHIKHDDLIKGYHSACENLSKKYKVYEISNDGPISESLKSIITCLSQLKMIEKGTEYALKERVEQLPHPQKKQIGQPELFCDEIVGSAKSSIRHSGKSYVSPAVPTKVYETFWHFACERQNVFFRRIQSDSSPWSKDEVIQNFKFTNAYRASDRVSQFLIKNVIYSSKWGVEDMFFRIILFKIFNKISTWRTIEQKLGEISWDCYDFNRYDKILRDLMNKGVTIFSAAYIMPSGSKSSLYKYKHQRFLKLLEKMMKDDLPTKINIAKNMQEVFYLLRQYEMIGDFLAYQYATDLNYSTLTDFSEMEFVMPGPGALRGIRKCFSSLGGLNEVEIIKRIASFQNEELSSRGLEFKRIGDRPLQLIDIQNLFCEVDKYSRVVHPEICIGKKTMRIKQKFKPVKQKIEYYYPPKWNVQIKS